MFQVEDAENYWFAFVLYYVKRLSKSSANDSSQGVRENGLTLCHILRVAKLKYASLIPLIIVSFYNLAFLILFFYPSFYSIVDFFKELPQFIIKAGPILSNQYGADWEKRLEVPVVFEV